MGADYSFYVKKIETHARAFLVLNILAIGRVWNALSHLRYQYADKGPRNVLGYEGAPPGHVGLGTRGRIPTDFW